MLWLRTGAGSWRCPVPVRSTSTASGLATVQELTRHQRGVFALSATEMKFPLPTNAGVGGLFREEDVAIALDHAGDWHERQFELAEILHEREITHHAKNDTLALRVAVGGHK